MVRILANGDIVQDDDPRVQRPPHSGNAPTNRGSRMGNVQQNTDPHQHGHDGQGAGGYRVQNVSIFQTLNQRLLDLGIPCFNLGPYNIQPVVTVAFILAALLFGLPGLLFAGILFGVVMLSGGGNGSGGGGGATQGGGGQRPGGGDGQQRHRGGRILRHR